MTDEYMLIIKTTADNYDAVETYIEKAHPYTLPEVIAVPIVSGLTAYLTWLNANVG